MWGVIVARYCEERCNHGTLVLAFVTIYLLLILEIEWIAFDSYDDNMNILCMYHHVSHVSINMCKNFDCEPHNVLRKQMASPSSYIFQDLDRSDGLESQRFRPKSCFSGVRFHSSALGRHFRRSMAMGLPYSGWAVFQGVVRQGILWRAIWSL